MGLKGSEKVRSLSRLARECARISARKAGLEIDRFDKNTSGVPQPSKGVYWSVTHKLEYTAGIAAPHPVGIDIEWLKPIWSQTQSKEKNSISDRLFYRIVTPEEQQLFGTVETHITFFRTFTAKEAVLKKTGLGLTGLSKTKVINTIDDQYLMIQSSNKKFLVENYYFDDYIAAVTKEKHQIQWQVNPLNNAE